MKVAKTYNLEPVSDQLQKTLNQEARKLASDRKDEVATLLNSASFVSSYNACIWWDGCYYCKDENNSWYCIKCTFF
jgi:hypothetical protein